MSFLSFRNVFLNKTWTFVSYRYPHVDTDVRRGRRIVVANALVSDQMQMEGRRTEKSAVARLRTIKEEGG